MQSLIEEKRDDSALSFILVAVMTGLYLTNVVSGIGRYIGLTSPMITLAAKVIILCAIIRCALIFLYRINAAMAVTTYILLFVIAIQLAFFPENGQFLAGSGRGGVMESTVAMFVITILPAIYTISVIRDFDILLHRLQNAAMVISAFTLMVLMIYGGEAFEHYSMGFGNAMILPTCLTMTKAAEANQKPMVKRTAVILSVVDVFAEAMYGSRGAFVAVVGFTVYYFLWEQIRQRKPIAIVDTGVILLLAGTYKKLLKLVNDFASSLGYYSRTLTSLASDHVSDSGRSNLYDPIKREIMAAPLRIRGINSDWESVGFYCHNWILEIVHAFGVLLGGFFCVAIATMIGKVLWRGRTDSRSILMICLTFVFFPVCLVSGSVWESSWFWTWLALVLLSDGKNDKTTPSSM